MEASKKEGVSLTIRSMKDIIFHFGDSPLRADEVRTAIKAFAYGNKDFRIRLLSRKEDVGTLSQEKDVLVSSIEEEGTGRALSLLKEKESAALVSVLSPEALRSASKIPFALSYFFEGANAGHQSALLLLSEEMLPKGIEDALQNVIYFLVHINKEDFQKASVGFLSYPEAKRREIEKSLSNLASFDEVPLDKAILGEKNIYIAPYREGLFYLAGLNAGKRFEEERLTQKNLNAKNPFTRLFESRKKRKLEIIEESAFVYGFDKPFLLFPKDVSYGSAMSGLRAIETLLKEME